MMLHSAPFLQLRNLASHFDLYHKGAGATPSTRKTWSRPAVPVGGTERALARNRTPMRRGRRIGVFAAYINGLAVFGVAGRIFQGRGRAAEAKVLRQSSASVLPY
jgi:hypothetical protein